MENLGSPDHLERGDLTDNLEAKGSLDHRENKAKEDRRVKLDLLVQLDLPDRMEIEDVLDHKVHLVCSVFVCFRHHNNIANHIRNGRLNHIRQCSFLQGRYYRLKFRK